MLVCSYRSTLSQSCKYISRASKSQINQFVDLYRIILSSVVTVTLRPPMAIQSITFICDDKCVEHEKSTISWFKPACSDRFNTLAALPSFPLEFCIYSTSMLRPQGPVLYILTILALCTAPSEPIALSRQPESLILDNKISLPFKPCQIPLE